MCRYPARLDYLKESSGQLFQKWKINLFVNTYSDPDLSAQEYRIKDDKKPFCPFFVFVCPERIEQSLKAKKNNSKQRGCHRQRMVEGQTDSQFCCSLTNGKLNTNLLLELLVDVPGPSRFDVNAGLGLQR